MMKAARSSPIFLFLLPIFFVFHGFVENMGFIRFTDCLPLMGIYLLAATALYLIFLLFLKKPDKAALAAFYPLSFYFFFGSLHDFLRHHSIFLHRYSIILPIFGVSALCWILWLRKKTSLPKLVFFLNGLLILYLIVDGLAGVWKAARPGLSPRATASQLSKSYQGCDTCSRPDIYLLIFDEYAATRTLRDVYGYDNSPLDSFLRGQGFHQPLYSRSNYNITPFSMASILNLSYLEEIPPSLEVQPDDYANMLDRIRNSEVVDFLAAKGYTIINNSPFDLPGHLCSVEQPFIPVKTSLITRRTLLNYIIRDLGDWIALHIHDASEVVSGDITSIHKMNTGFLTATREESSRSSDRPRFVYMHVLMPHIPFMFDSSLHQRSLPDIKRHFQQNDPADYLGYLPYTNACIRELITGIKRNSGGRAVILFGSDHGFRYSSREKPNEPSYFNNQNAVYFPDRDYSLFYDSITGVNQFRVVFNKLFHLNLPLLKDSTLFLRDKGPGW